MDWLPQIGGFSVGMILAVILEFAKLFGLHEDDAGKVALGVGVIWAVIAVVLGQFPQYTSWVTIVLQFVLLLGSVPIGAKVGYSGVVKPVNNKAWNSEPNL